MDVKVIKATLVLIIFFLSKWLVHINKSIQVFDTMILTYILISLQDSLAYI